MDKQKLEDRIKVLEQERVNLVQNVLAYDGAIQDCKWWLDQLEKSIEQDSSK